MALKELPENSVDAIITDPPYGLSFMGKKWDYDVPSVEIWAECLRVLKPGGYLLAFAGTRTQHRMAVRIEDAGFEIRDMIAWIYGSGFPKSLNIGKAVDKLQGNEREDLGFREDFRKRARKNGVESKDYIMAGGWKSTEDTVGKLDRGHTEYEGWGTALKPALEPITVARKPLSENTVAENCLKWGVGGINIDESRVGMSQDDIDMLEAKSSKEFVGVKPFGNTEIKGSALKPNELGRFPANLIHDGSDQVLGLFPETKTNGVKTPFVGDPSSKINIGGGNVKPYETNSGSAARFFYCAKASKSERNRGCEGLEDKKPHTTYAGDAWSLEHLGNTPANYRENVKNNHPTVKPIALMEYLVKLVSKEGHTVLDPFLGSGTTAIACKNLNRNCIGIERDAEYVKISEARISAVK